MAAAAPKRRQRMAQINVVPYIDVMLVLLVIFMVTAPLLQTGVEVDLPKVEAKPIDDDQQPDALVVTVTRDGQFSIPGGEALSDDDLIAYVQQKFKAASKPDVFVRGDQAVAYGRVVEAMVILQQAGAEQVGLITDPPER